MLNKDYAEQTAKNIIQSLKDGTSPLIRPWKADVLNSALPYNPITKKPYNGINSLNLMMKNYDDPRWLTFKQARSIGAFVNKGEKSSLIEYWQFDEIVNKLDENGNPIKNESGEFQKIKIHLERPKIFYAYVFNAEQISNMPVIEHKPLIDNFKVIKEAEDILKNSGANIIHKGNQSFYNFEKDYINLPLKDDFISEGAYYAIALHELGHWSGHESRLNRDIKHPFGSEGYAKEELRAEIASFMLSGRLGLDYDPKQHLAYIDNWAKILEDKPLEIFKATSDATKIVNFIDGFRLEQDMKKDMIIEAQNTKALNLAETKTFLYVPFEQKDEAKKVGAKWDKESKMWYAPKGANLDKFTKWQTSKEQPTTNAIDEFKAALNKAELIIDEEPIMDGKLHRVAVIGDKGKQKSGAYVGFLNSHPAGYIQNFKTDYKQNWKSTTVNNILKDQEIDLKNAIEANKAIKEQRDKELEEAYLKTALKLESEYNNAKWANKDNAYLKAKGLDKNYYLKQDEHGNLLIPLKDINGKHWATQRIFSNGDKIIGATRTKEEKEANISYPAKKQGNFFLLGAKNLDNVKEVYICEGFATAASVYEATKKPSIMGVDAGNLEIVITNIKEKYPQISITIAADNDIKKEIENGVNVGKFTALKIQEKYKDIEVVIPKFTNEEVARNFSDFNDLAKSRGLQEVKKQLKEQIVKEIKATKATTKAKSIQKELVAKKDIALSI